MFALAAVRLEASPAQGPEQDKPGAHGNGHGVGYARGVGHALKARIASVYPHAKPRTFVIPNGAAHAVVIHDLPTNPANGKAGDRIACLAADF